MPRFASQDEALDAAAEALARAATRLATRTPRQIAEAAYQHGGPTVEELEQVAKALFAKARKRRPLPAAS